MSRSDITIVRQVFVLSILFNKKIYVEVVVIVVNPSVHAVCRVKKNFTCAVICHMVLSTTLCARRARVHIKGEGKGCVPGSKGRAVSGWNGEPISIPLPAHPPTPSRVLFNQSHACTMSRFPPWCGGVGISGPGCGELLRLGVDKKVSPVPHCGGRGSPIRWNAICDVVNVPPPGSRF